ncbi:hypothetical protein IV203_010728 [Nitzschia inconspicua]|uniref:Uncharacterized protein n=1 Tax=Nitzschia inconspicua TaxID=303405 RepID=A0A9K3KWZ7_9STRA|nr:hypothetical protein IV203_010728 [Nitzschia inconspicua]
MKYTITIEILLALEATYAMRHGGFPDISDIVAGSEINVLDCEVDKDVLQSARKILRDCNDENAIINPDGVDKKSDYYLGTDDGSLLEQCLDPDRGDGRNRRRRDRAETTLTDTFLIEDIEDLCNCCDAKKECKRVLEKAQRYIDECLTVGIGDEFMSYLQCIRMNYNQRRCDAETCWDSIFGKREPQDETNLVAEMVVFEEKNMEMRIGDDIVGTDIDSCARLAEFVDSTCEFGKNCCTTCNSELTTFLTSLANDVVLPFSRLANGESFRDAAIGGCTILEGDGHKHQCYMNMTAGRKLAMGTNRDERDRISLSSNLRPTLLSRVEMQLIKDRSAECDNVLTWNMMVSSRTATYKYLECMDLMTIETMSASLSSNEMVADEASELTKGMLCPVLAMAGVALLI